MLVSADESILLKLVFFHRNASNVFERDGDLIAG
jgi:hypothetical protein